MRPVALRTGVLLLVLLLAACTAGSPRSGGGPAVPEGTLRIASYDFGENQILAEVYAEAARRADVPVVVKHAVGTREILAPALEQGAVDLVVDYLGTAAEFLEAGAGSVHDHPAPLHEGLAETLQPRGLSVLAPAEAEDQNGFVVLTDLAGEQHLDRGRP